MDVTVELVDCDDFLASLSVPAAKTPKRSTRTHPSTVEMDIDAALGDVYAGMKDVEEVATRGALDRLVFGPQFDEEHIWQQIDAQNAQQRRRLNKRVKAGVESCEAHALMREMPDEEIADDGDDDDGDDDDGEQAVAIVRAPSRPTTAPSARHRRHYGVDDAFFSLDDMERHMDDNMAAIDLDEEGAQTINGASAMYTEFFDAPEGARAEGRVGEDGEGTPAKKVRFSAVNETRVIDGEAGGEDVPWHMKASKFAEDHHVHVEGAEAAVVDGKEEVVSELDLRNSRLKRRIEVLQNENLDAKSWELTGEATARDRPANSALEEHLQFDHGTRAAPIITETHTIKLEAVIRARIRDKIFDDVVRKAKPNVMPTELRSTVELDGSKSKDSLAAIYEKEYTDKREGGTTEDKTNPKHEAIDKLMRELFHDLDALTNFHFTPRQATAELRVVTNMRSMQREEVAPTIASHYSTLAPEQVVAASTSAPKAVEERATGDKKRERRLKKKLQHRRADNTDANTVLAKTSKRSKETSGTTSTGGRSTNSSKLFKTLQREAIDKVDELAKRGKHNDEPAMRRVLPVVPKPKNKARKARS